VPVRACRFESGQAHPVHSRNASQNDHGSIPSARTSAGQPMDAAWIAEERRLWDLMYGPQPLTLDSHKGARLSAKAKRAGKPLKLPTEEELVARSWRIYRQWLVH
jgi:hypothetical protein